jgi:hypothetical protein
LHGVTAHKARRTCAIAKYIYIAGYAAASFVGAGVSPACASVAKGLKSNDLRTSASLPRKARLREKKSLLMHNTFRREGAAGGMIGD